MEILFWGTFGLNFLLRMYRKTSFKQKLYFVEDFDDASKLYVVQETRAINPNFKVSYHL
jgi:hypothetical protein